MLGTAALTAKIYVSSIVFYVYVTGMSLGLSTAILMGWMTGAKEYEKAYRLNQQVLKIAVSLNIVLSVLIFLCHRPLMHLFTQSEEIIGMTGVIFLSIFLWKSGVHSTMSRTIRSGERGMCSFRWSSP
mgnify:CR=1 FL=1